MAPDNRRSRRPWLLALVLTSAAFVCGGLVGAVVTSGFLWKESLTAPRAAGFPRERLIEDARRSLGLNREQIQELGKVLEEHHQKMMAIHRDVRPRVMAELESLRTRIVSFLDAEQARQFTERFDSLKEQWLAPPAGPPLPPRAAFELVDADGDGRVTLEELWRKGPLSQELFEQADSDNDGSLTLDEFETLPPPPGPPGPPPGH